MTIPKCAFITFGCKVNQYETQIIRENLIARGYKETEPDDSPAIFIINTCSVTETAYKESIRFTRHIARKNPETKIIAIGCALKSNREQFSKIPGLTIINNKDENSVVDILTYGNVSSESAYIPSKNTISYFKNHTRAFLKIQDGCDLDCSFCIIPKLRGGNISRPLNEIIEEAKCLVGNGYQEIVLTGIHTGSYGKDLSTHQIQPVIKTNRLDGVKDLYNRPTLTDLIEKMLDIPNLKRIRLSSIEVNEITPELINLMATSHKLCPHLHLPLQSGADTILKAMRRRYNIKQYLKTVDNIRDKISDPAITTDIIVGFPGEEKRHFENTLEVSRQVGFSRIHIFPYSSRSGTDASQFSETVSKKEKKGRALELEKLAKNLAHDYYKKFEGKIVYVLIEKQEKNKVASGYQGKISTGYTERYIKAKIDREVETNNIIKARVTRVTNEYVEAGFQSVI